MTLEFLTDTTLRPMQHGFFTRVSGVSGGVYAGLNCGAGSNDSAESVAINRARVAKAARLRPDALVSLRQVHSAKVVTVTGAPWDGSPPEADAMVTKSAGVGLGILTADCAPVLFADKSAGVVGAAHAGWKGALAGVTDATIDAMVDLGAAREKIVAVVGPCISQKSYEVGFDFFEIFTSENPDYSRFFANGNGDKLLFDLPSFVLHRLRSAGITDANWIGRCTYNEPKSFYSYRRATHAGEADYGRMISVIRL